MIKISIWTNHVLTASINSASNVLWYFKLWIQGLKYSVKVIKVNRCEYSVQLTERRRQAYTTYHPPLGYKQIIISFIHQQRFTLSGCKDIWIRKLEIFAKARLISLHEENLVFKNWNPNLNTTIKNSYFYFKINCMPWQRVFIGIKR